MSKLLLMLVFASALAVFVVPSEGQGYSGLHHHHNHCICVPDLIACPISHPRFHGRLNRESWNWGDNTSDFSCAD
ncbi:hypothetical protein ACJMK2_007237 [Sinanodonta woodiana]|uniref:Uncharacterized protein n=1 Tax=Sinanodonta woodiana TaxID=1069815 RepID=A0ABD3VKX1_SINWO